MKARILLIALASAGLSSAAIVTYNVNYGPTSIGAADFTVSLPKFDPSLGALTGVSIVLDASTSGSTIVFDNEANVGGSVTLSVGTTVTATAPLITALVAVPLQIGSGTVTADNDGAPDFIGTDSIGVTTGSGSVSNTQTGSSGPILAAYTATLPLETFDVTINNLIAESFSSSGAYGPTQTTSGIFEGEVTVHYSYELTSVPEPSGLLSLGCLIGSGVCLRFRRKR